MKARTILVSVTLSALSFLCVSTNFAAQEQKQEIRVEQPKLLAVLFYADWCQSCKVLG